MSFGFGVGNVFAVGKIIGRIVVQLKDVRLLLVSRPFQFICLLTDLISRIAKRPLNTST